MARTGAAAGAGGDGSLAAATLSSRKAGDRSAPPKQAGSGKKAAKSGSKSKGDAATKAAAKLRGPGVEIKKIMDKKLKGRLKHSERVFRESQARAAQANDWLRSTDAGFLEAEGAERTWNAKQTDIVAAVDVGAARKVFDLRLPQLGPYAVDFSRNGRHVLLAGRLGHLAMMDWQQRSVHCEVQVAETVRDVCFLHNETFFAAAQKKYVYIYDKRGIEIHCLRDHVEPYAMQFLPHHFLLASVGKSGFLHYQDTSTGHIAASHRTALGPCSVMRQNPYNAVLGLGHTGGVVTMWTPNINTPVVKMLSHRGPVNAVAFDPSGHYMATAGADKQIKVWDVRTFKPLHSYFCFSPANSLDVSQRGLMAVGYGSKVQVWQDALQAKAAAPYMTHRMLDGVHLSDLQFAPYEDVLGLGSSDGYSSILVPGSGEPNFDSYVANPYASLRERREGEVAALLDKLQPNTIMLDPTMVGRVRKEPQEVQQQRQAENQAANAARLAAQRAESENKNKMKGKNKPSRRHRKKQNNIIEERKPRIRAGAKEQEQKKASAKRAAAKQSAAAAAPSVPRALERFVK